MPRRPKGSGNSKSAPSANGVVSISHNRTKEGTPAALTDAQKQRLVAQHVPEYERLLQAQKDANKDMKDFGKTVKADLGKHGMDQIKLMVALSDPDGEAESKAKLAAQIEAMRWAKLPIGTMEDLFPEDRANAAERAERDGYQTGVKGGDPKVPPQFAAQTADWMEGWNNGQGELRGKFGQKPAESPKPKGKGKTEAPPTQPAEEF